MKRLLVLLLATTALAACSSSGSSGSSSGATGKATAATGGTTSGASSGSGTTGTGASTGSSGSTGSACAKHEGDSCAATACCAGLTCDPTTHACQAPCTATTTCRALFDACDAAHPCCGSATCTGGVCTSAALPACKHDGDACGSGSDCCGNADAGLQLSCIPAGDGGSVCHDPGLGERCGGAIGCSPGLDCAFGDGGADAGACALPPGGRDGGAVTCTGSSGACQVGDPCDPRVDYCSSGGLTCDPTAHVCALPGLGAACTTACSQTPGASTPTVCAASQAASGKTCLPGCSTDTDCPFSTLLDTNTSVLVSQLCDKTDPAGPSACQPLICYVAASGGQTGFGSTSDFYKPCANHPDSLCVPSFQFGQQLGVCQAVRPGSASTVGQVCTAQASSGLPDLLCGKDATCLGGRCAPICDVQQGGTGTLPGCGATEQCIATSQVDLTEAFQVGGCGTPCDPWTADATKNGCPAQFCGGPPAACEWIIGDRVGSRPLGYCRPEVFAPLHEGDDCKSRPNDCATGLFCLSTNQARTTAACFRLCDATAPAGSPDACTGGKSCVAFQGFTHAGRCR